MIQFQEVLYIPVYKASFFGESNKTPGYAGGISELQLQAKTSYAIIILSPPRHKKA